ncbi:MAG: hypothetical protein ACYS4W_02070 [Planctomycetota bacterium]|jgi:hypothetical protein
MSRNLIAAKAWENGRKEVCTQCEHLGIRSREMPAYGWDNCQKLVKSVAVDYFSKWDGDTCRYFEPKLKPE